MNGPNEIAASLYCHGPQGCRACFADPGIPWHSPNTTPFAVRGHRWQLRANPGYWGATAPRILVLGFSKGPEQNGLIDNHIGNNGKTIRFEDIPFNDKKKIARGNLKKLLVELGVLDKVRDVDSLFQPYEEIFGFASLVRCTVTYAKPGSDVFVGSGGGITARTLELGAPFVETCADIHLRQLPRSVQLIVVLGATIGFVDGVRTLLRGEPLIEGCDTSYAYRYSGRPVVHIPHPSGGNNGAIAVFCGERPPSTKSQSEKNIPECRRQALATVEALQNRCTIS